MIVNGIIGIPSFLQDKKTYEDRGIDAMWSSPLNQRSKTGPQYVQRGSMNVLAILVDFSDNPSQVDATYFDDLLFGTGFGSMGHYFNAVSYGNLDIISVNMPSAIGWRSSSQSYAYYVDGQNGFGSYPKNSQGMAEDVINIVDGVVDFSNYDNDGDGYVDGIFII
ncbi:MAG: hypothetical protein IID12_07005, partial [Candidatus Marinimicrobia bacterium]|nr:hypothetical protein [Candidatus Neomarinimicrobiota bacterium]